MLDEPDTTLAEVGYLGENVPLEFGLCLRMRQELIKKVTIEDQEIKFETFKDNCSTFVSIPMTLKKAGLLRLKVTHEPFERRS